MQHCSKDEMKQLKSGITIIDETLCEVPETIEDSSQKITGNVNNLDGNTWHDEKLVYIKREDLDK